MDSRHIGIACDVCYENDIDGVRYYCLICDNYDLCEVCHQERRFNGEHRSYHPTQPVLFGQDILGHLNQEDSIFVCPSCGDKDFKLTDLVKHCKRYHLNDSQPVRCPICPVYNQGITRLLSASFLEHLLDIHREQCTINRTPSTSSAENPECSICLEIVPRTNDMQSLRCCHEFHRTCIEQWLEDNSTCPVCRTPA